MIDWNSILWPYLAEWRVGVYICVCVPIYKFSLCKRRKWVGIEELSLPQKRFMEMLNTVRVQQVTKNYSFRQQLKRANGP